MTIAVIIPAFNAADLLAETLLAIQSGRRVPDELMVVDDSSIDASAEVARKCGARVVVMPRNAGPAACRNHAALLVESDILVFLDADTLVHADTLEQMEAHFRLDPNLSAVIGAYDDTPRDAGLCSQYRNLAHCYVHRSAQRDALTFWSGCGAVLREAFLGNDGFDERYRRPSVEDIEFGYRMTARGLRILLDPGVQVTHAKRWTMANSVTTDLWDRGIPWMVLLLRRGNMPDDLNLKVSSRLATALTGASLLCILASLSALYWSLAALVFALLALVCDVGLFRFLHRERGARILPMAATMRLLQNVCNLAATAAGTFVWAMGSQWLQVAAPVERQSRIAEERKVRDEHPANASSPLPLA